VLIAKSIRGITRYHSQFFFTHYEKGHPCG
jgi:hypothetical protein